MGAHRLYFFLLVPVNFESVATVLIDNEPFDHVVPLEGEAAEALGVVKIVDLIGTGDVM